MTSTATLILMLYFIQGSLGHVLSQSPIVGIAGGHSVNIEDAPFMVIVMHTYVYNDPNFTTHLCGGSIIHKQFVLTTAFCVKNTRDISVIVRVGSSNYDKGGTLHEVEKYIRHKSFSSKTLINNVGLLKLTEPVTFGPSVAAIKLADDSVSITVGLTANVTGWATSDDDDYLVSSALKQVLVTVSPSGDCNPHNRDIPLTDKQICVSDQKNGACRFDRGGPVTAGDVQIGVVSYGTTCAGRPNVYEKVAPHLQWIQDTINENL